MAFRSPVTSIEKFHLIDDRPSNPNVIGCELTVSGKLDFEAANVAGRQTLQRHPLICAHLERGRWGRWYWVADESSYTDIQWETLGETTRFESPQTIDPWRGPAFRLIMRPDGDRTVIGIRMHHAAVDGLGGLQAMADWLTAYHHIKSGSDRPKLRQLDPSLLRQRNHLRLLSRKFLFKLWIQPIALLGATKFLFRKIETIAEQCDTQDTTSTEDFQLLSRALSPQAFQQLQQDTHQANATINEFLIRAVFLGLHRFRKETGHHKDGEWLRMMIPINIRDYADRRLPAANRASLVQLDRTDHDFEDVDGLIWTFNYELGNIRRWNLEKTFLLMVRCMSAIPGLCKRSASKKICRATSVLTNLGAPLDRIKLPRKNGKLVAGNLVVEDVDLIVPLRPLTPVGFAAVRYAGIQRLIMHFDPKQITPSDAEQLMDLVIEELIRGYKAE